VAMRLWYGLSREEKWLVLNLFSSYCSNKCQVGKGTLSPLCSEDFIASSMKSAGTGSPSQLENFADTQFSSSLFSSSLVTSRTCLLSSLTHKNL